MPVMDEAGYPYGYVARKLDTQPGPKTLSILENNDGSWYRCRGSHQIIVVEDQISALRCSRYVNAVALLGVNLTPGLAKKLKAGGYTGIYLALDPDAFPLSIKMAHVLKPQFRVQVVRLPKDLKDMNEDELVEQLHYIGVDFRGVKI